MPGIQNFNFTAPDWQAEQARIDRARRMAELLQQQSMTPIQEQPTAGGFTVPISPFQGLAKMLQAGTAGYGMHRADVQQKELAQRMGTSRAEMLARAIQMATGRPEGMGQPDPQELSQAADQGTSTPQPFQIPARPGNLTGAASMLMGSGDPVLSAVGGPMLAQALKGPESLFGKIDPKDYTPQSVAAYAATKNPAVLVPVRKLEGVTTTGGQGQPVTQFINPWEPPQQPIPQPVKQEFLNTGPSFQPVNPYAPTGPVATGLTPYQQQELPIQRGNLAVAQGNLGVNRTNSYFNTGMGSPGGGGIQTPDAQVPVTGIAPQGASRSDASNVSSAPSLPPVMNPKTLVTPKALAEREAQRPHEQARLTEISSTLDNLAASAKALISHKGMQGTWSATGLTGVVAGRIPGSESFDAASRLETLKNKIALAALAKMREDSKTGGALGQVSNYEDAMLANSISSLQNAQSTKQIMDSLKQVESWANAAKQRRHEAFNELYPDRRQSRGASGSFGLPNTNDIDAELARRSGAR